MEQIKKERMELEELYPTIKTVLSMGKDFLLYPNGKSMLPTIRPGIDAVLLSPPKDLKCGSLILYRRKNGVFVLHRIVAVSPDGSYVLRGDNQYYNEKGITPDQVIAVVHRFYRGKREVVCDCARHRAYLLSRKASYPLRCLFVRGIGKIKRSIKRHGK